MSEDMQFDYDEAQTFFDSIPGAKTGAGVNKRELTEFLKQHGKSEAEIEKCFKQFDVDNDGDIGKYEFLYAVCKKERKRGLTEQFQALDTDGSGCVSLDEIRTNCPMVKAVKGLQERFDAFDTDGNRTLNMEEFVKLMDSAE